VDFEKRSDGTTTACVDGKPLVCFYEDKFMQSYGGWNLPLAETIIRTCIMAHEDVHKEALDCPSTPGITLIPQTPLLEMDGYAAESDCYNDHLVPLLPSGDDALVKNAKKDACYAYSVNWGLQNCQSPDLYLYPGCH
jgi:hypothetical protein